MADRLDAVRYDLSPRETAWPTLLLCAASCLFQGLSAGAGLSGLAPAWTAVLLCAAAAYAQFTVLHDAVHGSVSRFKPLNDGAGMVAALALFGPFAAFKRNHLHHHAHTNDPAEDPDFWVARGPGWAGLLFRCLTMLQFHYWSYLTRLRRRDGAFAATVLTLAGFAAVLLWGAWAGRLGALLLYWVLPAQLAVAALAFLFDYWPHRPHTGRGRLKDTAALVSAWLDPFFLAQNLHLLHHLNPTVPWYRYRRAFAAVEPALRREGALLWGFPKALAMLKP